MIDASFYNFLTTLTTYPVQQDVTDESIGQPRVWFQRRSQTTDTFLDGTPFGTDTTFDVEVVGLDIDLVQNTANTLRTALNGYRGFMLFDIVLGTFVEDADDDYISKAALDSDAGLHVAAFKVRILS